MSSAAEEMRERKEEDDVFFLGLFWLRLKKVGKKFNVKGIQ